MRPTPMLFSDWRPVGGHGKQIDETVAPFVAERDIMQKDFKVPKTSLSPRPLATDHLVQVPPQVGAVRPSRATLVVGA